MIFASPICLGGSGRELLYRKLRCLQSEQPSDFFSHLTCSIRKDREQGFNFLPIRLTSNISKIAHKTCFLVMDEIVQTETVSVKMVDPSEISP